MPRWIARRAKSVKVSPAAVNAYRKGMATNPALHAGNDKALVMELYRAMQLAGVWHRSMYEGNCGNGLMKQLFHPLIRPRHPARAWHSPLPS